MVTCPSRAFLFLAVSLSACRSSSAPAGDVVASAEPAGKTEAQRVHDEDFQFTIDGMRRINGAL